MQICIESLEILLTRQEIPKLWGPPHWAYCTFMDIGILHFEWAKDRIALEKNYKIFNSSAFLLSQSFVPCAK